MARELGRKLSLLVIVLVFLLTGTCAAPTEQDHSRLLITEISPHELEYVELHNPTDSEIELLGFHVCYYSDTKTTWDDPYRVKPFPPHASIAPHGFFLIGFGDNWASSQVGADWWAYSSKQLSGRSGAIAVFSGAPSARTLVDAVGWGSSMLAEGVPAPAPPDGLTLSRTVDVGLGEPFLDTNYNASDLVHTLPTPCNSVVGTTLAVLGVESGSCEDSELAIQYQLCNRGRAQEVFIVEIDDELGWTESRSPIEHKLSPRECTKGDVRIELPCDLDFYVLDLETTNTMRFDEIIEIAWVHFRGSQPIQTFSSLVCPKFHFIDPDAQEVHGITIEQILEAEAPSIEEVLPDVLNELSGNIVVAHSARFDKRFLDEATDEKDIPLLESFFWRDTLALSRLAFPGLESYKLSSLAAELSLSDPQHRALPDAYVAGALFLRCMKELGNTVTLAVATVSRLPLSGIVLVSVVLPGLQD